MAIGEDDMMTDGDVSGDNDVEDGEDDAWFGMEMTCAEKLEAQPPWQNNLIIKLIDRSIG